MPWVSDIKLDDGKTDVGFIKVVWNEGLADEFIYGRRSRMTLAEGNKIKSEAEAAKTYAIAQTAKEATLEATLDGIMNG